MKDKEGNWVGYIAWAGFERIVSQLVSTIISIILARLLCPADYGIIAIVNIFIAFANIFLTYGINTALIQKKNVDDLDYSSVLYFNIVLTVVIYSILFFSSPLISAFYGEGYEIFTPVLRILGLRLIITGITTVQRAYISKNMLFKKLFFSTMIGIILSAAIGIVMALRGYGVWALVAQSLFSVTINAITFCVSLDWKPLLRFSYARLKALWKYGSFMLVSGILMGIFEEIRTLIIGKKYSLDELAYYDKGKHFPALLVNTVNNTMSTVLFPKMANVQDDIDKLRQITRNTIRFSSFFICPVILGFLAVAENFVLVILTEKWLPAVSILRCFCIFYLFQPMHTANVQAIKALGRSDIFLKLEIVKKTIEIIVLIITLTISVNAIVYGMTVLSILFTIINAYPNGRLIKYNFLQQTKDIRGSFINASIMAVVVYVLNDLPISDILQLLVQIIVGSIVYVLLNVITKNEEFKYICVIFRFKVQKRRIKND